MPDGKRVTVAAKVSDGEAAVIDARCAALGITRSAWLRSLIEASLADVRDVGEAYGLRVRSDPEMPPGTVALVSVGQPPVLMRNVTDGADCKHPKGSVIKGRCTRCRSFVGFA